MIGMQPASSQIQVRLEIERLRTGQVTAHIPSRSDCPDCGYDPFTDAGLDISCATCGGTGKVTTWQVSHVGVRVMWPEQVSPIWGTMATGPIGDVWLQTAYRFKALMEKVKDTDGAYILVDDETVKPISFRPNRVQGISSLDVRCEVVRHDTG